MAKHTYSVGTRDFKTLTAARKDAREYANEIGRPVTITHLIQKTDVHTRTRGRVLGFSASSIKYGADIEVQPTKTSNPKHKRRKKNFLGFGRGGLFSTSTVYHVDRRKASKTGKPEETVTFKGHQIVKRGREFFVPSLDPTPFQRLDDAKLFIASIVGGGKVKNPGRTIIPVQIKVERGKIRVFATPAAIRKLNGGR